MLLVPLMCLTFLLHPPARLSILLELLTDMLFISEPLIREQLLLHLLLFGRRGGHRLRLYGERRLSG